MTDEERAEEVERDIRIAIWNAGKWQGKPGEVAQSLIRKAMADPTMQRALATLSAAPTVDIREDMVLVPREPTEAMRRAFSDSTSFRDGWAAMIAALSVGVVTEEQ